MRENGYSYYFLLTFSTENQAKIFWERITSQQNPPVRTVLLWGSWISLDYGNVQRWFVAWLTNGRSESNAIDRWWHSFRPEDTPSGAGYGSLDSPLGVRMKIDKVYEKTSVYEPGTNQVSTHNPSVKKPTIEWASIPAGTFTMGSPASEVDRTSNETQHQVTMSAFKMSKYETTFEQYDMFCEATGREKPSDEDWGRGNRPVIDVSWDDATAFAEWMGCRLPTEAEWEYACRAGTTTPFNTGSNLTTSQANYDGNYPYNNNAKGEYREKTMPVGSFAPNTWGLYDMHGNVREWCSDWYGAYSTGAQTSPKGPVSGSDRVRRGGSWSGGAWFCRSAYRGDCSPAGRDDLMGIRLVSPK